MGARRVGRALSARRQTGSHGGVPQCGAPYLHHEIFRLERVNQERSRRGHEAHRWLRRSIPDMETGTADQCAVRKFILFFPRLRMRSGEQIPPG